MSSSGPFKLRMSRKTFVNAFGILGPGQCRQLNSESGTTSPSLGFTTTTNNTPALFTLNISFRDGIRWQRVRRRLEPAAEHFAGRFHPSKKRTSCFKLFRQTEENHFFSETKFEGLGRCRRRRRCCRRCRRCRRRCCCC